MTTRYTDDSPPDLRAFDAAIPRSRWLTFDGDYETDEDAEEEVEDADDAAYSADFEARHGFAASVVNGVDGGEDAEYAAMFAARFGRAATL